MTETRSEQRARLLLREIYAYLDDQPAEDLASAGRLATLQRAVSRAS